MKKNNFPWALSLLFGLTVSLISPAMPAEAADTPDIDSTAIEETSADSADSYVQGEVIVTLATPKRTTLAKEGTVSFDGEISVDESWNFGDARVLANTEEQETYLEDKKFYVSKVSSDTYSTEELMKELSGQAYVVSVEPNYYRKKMSASPDTLSGQQWYLNGSGAYKTQSEGVRHQKFTASSSQTPVVAVVDTGIDYTHEDLRDHMWNNTYSSLEGVCGYDFGDKDADPMDEDESGHGTHCAGVIGAVADNGTGITGVCSDVRLMALKIFNSRDEAEDSAIIGAFNYIYRAQQLGVNVTAVNCSWGGGESSQTMESLIDKIGGEGALFLFAAGNDSTNQDTVASLRKECPYDMSSSYIVVVGASDTDDKAASFSDYGSNSVDIFVPGVQILSTVNYTNFLPSTYTEEQRNSLTSLYSDGKEGSAVLYTPSDLNISFNRISYGAVEHSTEDFYGDSESGCFLIPFHTMSTKISSVSAYMDVSGLSLDNSATYYLACDISLKSSNTLAEEEREWSHFTRKISASDLITSNGKTYLRLITLDAVLFPYSGLYIDEVAISCANPDTASFGKYDYMEGTSMAAPIVSGAVAALSGMYPSDSATGRKERLLSCVRAVSDLTYKCKTGGILDMSLFATSKAPENSSETPDSGEEEIKKNSDSPSASAKIAVKKVTLNKKTAKLRFKKKLKLKATVSPSNAANKKVKWSVSKTKYAKVTQKGVVTAKKKGIGHTIKVYAASKADKTKKASCKVKIRA